MNRNIYTKKDLARDRVRGEDESKAVDKYASKLVKYIPSEIVALYVPLQAMLRAQESEQCVLFWIIFCFCLVMTPLYLWKIGKVERKVQILISTGAFLVWAFTMGGPFALYDWYNPLYGALIMPMYTFLIPFFDL